MVSAFAACQRLVMGQVAVAEKSNEIVAIPALLDMADTPATVITPIERFWCKRLKRGKFAAKSLFEGHCCIGQPETQFATLLARPSGEAEESVHKTHFSCRARFLDKTLPLADHAHDLEAFDRRRSRGVGRI
jgi:hypothetical protein